MSKCELLSEYFDFTSDEDDHDDDDHHCIYSQDDHDDDGHHSIYSLYDDDHKWGLPTITSSSKVDGQGLGMIDESDDDSDDTTQN